MKSKEFYEIIKEKVLDDLNTIKNYAEYCKKVYEYKDFSVFFSSLLPKKLFGVINLCDYMEKYDLNDDNIIAYTKSILKSVNIL